MLYLNAKEIREIFSMREAIESDREAFMIQAEGLAEVPVRTNFDVVKDGITSFMPALIKKYPRAGIKIVSTYTENYKRGMSAVSATVLLADPETGVVNAMLDGTELTRMRTGAVSGLATELLSNEDAERGALFGTGGQADTYFRSPHDDFRPDLWGRRYGHGAGNKEAACGSRGKAEGGYPHDNP